MHFEVRRRRRRREGEEDYLTISERGGGEAKRIGGRGGGERGIVHDRVAFDDADPVFVRSRGESEDLSP